MGLFDFFSRLPMPPKAGKRLSLLLHERAIKKLERKREVGQLSAAEQARLDVYRQRVRTWTHDS